MSNRKARRAIRAIAKQEGLSIKEVRREIKYAMELAQQCKSPCAVSYWNQLSQGRTGPTPEDVIESLSQSLDKGMGESKKKG